MYNLQYISIYIEIPPYFSECISADRTLFGELYIGGNGGHAEPLIFALAVTKQTIELCVSWLTSQPLVLLSLQSLK